jgi:hypothetical protein
MSMHLESHAYTTTSTKKAKEKKPTKAMLNQWKADYDSQMRERKRTNQRTCTFSQWLDERKGIVTHLKPLPVTKSTSFNFNANKAVIRDTGPRHPSRNPADVTPAIAPPTKVYTGDAMIGIGQLHKSNAVPVFKQSDAEDISKMRR